MKTVYVLDFYYSDRIEVFRTIEEARKALKRIYAEKFHEWYGEGSLDIEMIKHDFAQMDGEMPWLEDVATVREAVMCD